MFDIRCAEEKDCELILQFIRRLADYEKLLHEVTATVDDVRRELFSATPSAHALIAYEDDKPVGFALYFYNFSTFLGKAGIYLEDLFVKPEYRRRGYGKALLSYLAKLTVERGCGRLEWSCLDWNQSAIDFYHAWGAVTMDDWTTFRMSGETLKRMAG